MSNILFLANLNPSKFGSGEEQALFLSEEITRRGDNSFLAFVAAPEEEMKRRFEAAGARVLTFDCGSPSIVGKIRGILSIYRVIKSNKIDLVHVMHIGLTDLIMLGAYLSRARIVYNDQESGWPSPRPTWKTIIARFVHFFISRRISKYVAITQFVSNRLQRVNYVDDAKISTIYNAVNLERFRPLESSEVRNKLHLPRNRKILCAVAMLIPEKGIQVLLRAMARLKEVYGMKDALLLVVGEGGYLDVLNRLTDELGIRENVAFLGKRDDVHLIIAASDVVVVPSIWEEAFGRIIAEALACARPVVATTVGGIPELIEEGETGFLVKPDDSDGLASALNAILSDQGKQMKLGEHARKQALAKFDLRRQTQVLVDLYLSLIHHPASDQ